MQKKINIEKILKNYDPKKIRYNSEKNIVEDDLEILLKTTKEDEFLYLGTEKFFRNCFEIYYNSMWYIKAVFHIGFPFVYGFGGILGKDRIESLLNISEHNDYPISTDVLFEPWYIFVFSKKRPDKILLGFNNNDYLSYKYTYLLDSSMTKVVPEEMLFRPIYDSNNPYIDYYKAIQETIEKNKIIERRKEFEQYIDVDFEFAEVPAKYFYFPNIIYLYRYKNSVVDIFGFPESNERIVALKNFVDFLNPNSNGFYSVKKNDVIVNYIHIDGNEHKIFVNIWLAEKESKKIKASAVIRTKNISPYYLMVYLESDFIKDYCLHNMLSREKNENYHNLIEHDVDVTELPIIWSDIDPRYYKRKYEFSRFQKLHMQQKLEDKPSVIFYDSSAKEIILEDMKELKKCFNDGAYKATIILAGSILEAFLIDWLSEIEGKNYFKQDKMIYDNYRKRRRRANLKDYIKAIKVLNNPSWRDAATKADEIRKKRNLIHAKLYIKDTDISKETCTEIIDYLEFVINTRWKIE